MFCHKKNNLEEFFEDFGGILLEPLIRQRVLHEVKQMKVNA